MTIPAHRTLSHRWNAVRRVRVSQLTWSIATNVASRGWAALISIAFVPLYIKLMGIEAYGLIGFYASLLALFNLLDLGLSATLNREMVRYSIRPESAHEARDLLRTVEVGYWAIGLVLGGILIILAPWIAHDWVRADKLSPSTIERTVMAMGLVTAFQWPLSLYEGGLMGLQYQVLTSGIRAGAATLRGVGAILILWGVSPTILAFFVWQMGVSALQTGLTACCLWRRLLRTERKPRFQPRLLLNLWRFATGISAIAVVALTLQQLDKLVLSKLLSLETFGYYSLAGTVAGGLAVLIAPQFEAMYPRFSRLVALGDGPTLRTLYHKGGQLMSVLMFPIAAVFALFSRELLLLWTGSQVTATSTYLLASVLTAGIALNGVTYLPYALQVAHGRTRLVLLVSLAALVLFVPGVTLLIVHYGALGAATAVLLLNAGMVLIGGRVMNHGLWPDERWRWHVEDVGYPLVAAVAVAVTGRLLIHAEWPTPLLLLGVAATAIASALAAALAAPDIRASLVSTTTRMRTDYRGLRRPS